MTSNARKIVLKYKALRNNHVVDLINQKRHILTDFGLHVSGKMRLENTKLQQQHKSKCDNIAFF